MKKILICVLFAVIFSFSAFTDSSVNFESGRFVLGGSASMDIYPEELLYSNIRLNPDIGFLVIDNLLLELGVNFRFQDEFLYLGMDSGIRYYFSGPVLVPSIGTIMTYNIIDDFFGNDSLLNLWLSIDLDFFLLENLSFFTEINSPRFYLLDSTFDYYDSFNINFGFHFFVPIGPLEFSN